MPAPIAPPDGSTLTAVIVPVGAAEPLVGAHRLRLDRSAAWGVPAHVTVVFPFVAPGEMDDVLVVSLRAAVATVPAFDCTFTGCRWFGDDVLWLAPDHSAELRALTAAVVGRFPAHQPYGGEFDDVVPHLTIGSMPEATTAELRAVEAEVDAGLPLATRVDHALLIAGTDRPDSWRTVAELPLG